MALFQKKTAGDPEAEDPEAEDPKELLTQLRRYWDEGTSAMENRRKKWKRQYNYWINRQLSPSRPNYKSDIRVNYCWVVT